jgi:hypothetical protein
MDDQRSIRHFLSGGAVAQQRRSRGIIVESSLGQSNCQWTMRKDMALRDWDGAIRRSNFWCLRLFASLQSLVSSRNQSAMLPGHELIHHSKQ